MQLYLSRLLIFVMFLSTQLMEGQGYTNYTVKDGLPSNHIYRVTQDNKGFIWIITDRGISKFDGTRFKNFTTLDGLPTNDIWNIRITPDDRVWYFSKSNQLGYIESDIVYSFSSIDETEMSPVQINEEGNSVSFSNVEYHYFLKDSLWQKEEMPKNIFPLTDSGTYVKYENVHYTLYNKNRILPGSKFALNDFAFIRSKLNDSVFTNVSNTSFLIYNFVNEHGKNIKYTDDKNLPSKLDYARFHAVNKQIQFTGDGFLGILDNNFNWESTYNIPKSLKAHFSFKDKKGVIWAATFNNGLYKLPANYTTAKTTFPTQEIQHVQFLDDVLYLTVKDEGLFKIENQNTERFTTINTHINGICKSGDSLLIPHSTATLIIDKNGHQKEISNRTFIRGKRFITHKDRLWSDGYGSLFVYYPQSFKSKSFTDNYKYLFSQDGELYVFKNKSLHKFNEEKELFKNFGNFKIRSKVTSIKSYDWGTYIGTEGDGLYLFKNKKLSKLEIGDARHITQIAAENEDNVWALVNDKLHNYSTKKGVLSINKYSQLDGFPTSIVTQVVIREGTMYLGTKKGLLEFDLASINLDSNFDLYVANITLNDNQVDDLCIKTQYQKNQDISVSFGALQFAGATPQYEYRLMPSNNRWLPTENGRVTITNLSPGNYKLQLKATVNNQEKQTEIPIEIAPLWYQTIFFRILAVLLLLLGFGYIVYCVTRISENKKRNRLAQEKKLSEIQLRALRTQMNPHFVFNSLAAIQYFFNENENDKGDEYLVKFSRLIRQFFELADKKEIKISEEKHLLINYLDVEKLRFKDKFNYIIQVPKTLEQRTMPSMLLQPIVENAINHGIFNKETNGTVQIEFKSGDENRLIVSVTDDGVGYRKTQKGKDLRLKSSNVLEDRLFYLNQSGSWEIHIAQNEAFPDSEDCGHQTTFTIKPKKQ